MDVIKLIFYFIFCGTISFCQSSILPNSANLQKCQVDYSQLVGNLVAVEGTDAVTMLWRLIFNQFDLNGNKRVGTAELVISLETANLLKQSNTQEVYKSINNYMITDASENGVEEETFKETVSTAIGRSETIKMPFNYICEYVTNQGYIVSAALQGFRQNISQIKATLRNILEKNNSPEQTLSNIWDGIYKSLDLNHDEQVTVEELIQLYNKYINETADENLEMELNRIREVFRLQSSTDHFAVTKKEFYLNMKSVLYDTDKFIDGIDTINQLKGLNNFNYILAEVFKDFKTMLDKSIECKCSYMKALDSYLGKDKSISSDFLFTLFDASKDGQVNLSEISDVVTSSKKIDFNFTFLEVVQKDISSFTSDEFSHFLPNNIVTSSTNSSDKKMQLSALSIIQLQNWNAFCFTVKDIIQQYSFQWSPINEVTDLISSIDVIIDASSEELNVVKDELLQLSKKIERVLKSDEDDIDTPMTSTNEVGSSTTATFTTDPQTSTDSEERIYSTFAPEKAISEVVTQDFEFTKATNTTINQFEDELSGLIKDIIEDIKEGKQVSVQEEKQAETDAQNISLEDKKQIEKVETQLENLFSVSEQQSSASQVNQLTKEEKELLELLNSN